MVKVCIHAEWERRPQGVLPTAWGSDQLLCIVSNTWILEQYSSWLVCWGPYLSLRPPNMYILSPMPVAEWKSRHRAGSPLWSQHNHNPLKTSKHSHWLYITQFSSQRHSRGRNSISFLFLKSLSYPIKFPNERETNDYIINPLTAVLISSTRHELCALGNLRCGTGRCL